MVGMGMAMLLIAWLGAFFIIRKKPLPSWLLKTYIAMTFSGWVATIAGWYVTEIGRQPYLVSGVLRTADAVTDIAPVNVGISLTLYCSLYVCLLIAYLLTLRNMAKRSAAIEDDIRYQTPVTSNV
jgi:cytochrome d ubiquinol oxidase subunit I